MTAPDLLQQDEANRQRALELRSFIVEAPAGACPRPMLPSSSSTSASMVGRPRLSQMRRPRRDRIRGARIRAVD